MKTYTAVVEHCPDTGLYAGTFRVFLGRTAKQRRWMN
jgi:hypothetical protein